MFKSIWFYLFDPKGGRKLFNTLKKLSDADSLTERRRIVEDHPELLSQEAKRLLNGILADEEDEEVIQHIVSLQDFLGHSRRLTPMEKAQKAFQAAASLKFSVSGEGQNEEE